MSSEQTEAEATQAQAARGSSAGALLREFRVKQGLHIGAMAATLKVPQAKLEALENDRLAELPDATFARALAKAMCRVLKVDANPVLERLPRGNEPELVVSRGLNQAYREHDARAEGLSLAVLQRPVVLGAIFLLLGAAAIYLLPSDFVEKMSQAQPKVPEAVLVPSLPAASSSAVLPAAPALVESTVIDAGSVASAPAHKPLPAAELPGNSAAAVSPATAPATPAARPASNAAAPSAGSVPLIVKTSAESWVEVIDARGQVLLSRTLRSGEELSLAGVAPLKIKVGNVAGTEMMLRGSKVDLAGQAQSNVARLELN